MTKISNAIAVAITQRQSVSARYSGFVRELCPHALGWKDGREQCLFFQFAGSSKSGLPAGGMWRCLPLAKLQVLRVYTGPWHSRPDYWNKVTCIDAITVGVP